MILFTSILYFNNCLLVNLTMWQLHCQLHRQLHVNSPFQKFYNLIDNNTKSIRHSKATKILNARILIILYVTLRALRRVFICFIHLKIPQMQ